MSELLFEDDEILNGPAKKKHITSVTVNDDCTVTLYSPKGKEEDRLKPFFLLSDRDLLAGFKKHVEVEELSGNMHFKYLCFVENFSALDSAKNFIKKSMGQKYTDHIFIITSPIQQYLIQSGITMFGGTRYEDIKRLQLDIETYSTKGFSNAVRPDDCIIMVSMKDSSGWERVISGKDYSEESLIQEMIAEIQRRDPDVIEGHNIFNFDLPYIETRAAKYSIPLVLGRDGSLLKSRPSRLNIAERVVAYRKYDIAGRELADTMILAQMYDISARELESYGLKDLARYFDVSPANRTYIKGDEIAWHYDNKPDELLKYALDDVRETDGISRVLSQSFFYQAKIFPFSYQEILVKGNATKIDALLLRNYIHNKYSIPKAPSQQAFEGGYTDILKQGVINTRVLNCDVQSLYPSIMLIYSFFPRLDSLNIFSYTLKLLRDYRLKAKELMNKSEGPKERNYYNSLQSAFKILINSYYGYLGSSFGHFADFEQAKQITSKGREILKDMVQWLQNRNAEVIEIDTDGIYFVPPPDIQTLKDEEDFVEELSKILDPKMKIDISGRYKGMISYKSKNYATLDEKNRLVIRGSGLRSRGLELFQRKFIEKLFYDILVNEGKKDNIVIVDELYNQYRNELKEGKWDIKMFRKMETLKDTLSSYKEKIDNSKRNKSAIYELALASNKDYKPGDSIYFYITGNEKNVKSFENCKMASEWKAQNPDHNIPYYEKKLAELHKKMKTFLLGEEVKE